MKLYRIEFEVSKRIKLIEKAGSDIEDAFWKITIKYHRAAKPPKLISYSLIEEYCEHAQVDGSGWMKACDDLRTRSVSLEKQIGEKEYAKRILGFVPKFLMGN